MKATVIFVDDEVDFLDMLKILFKEEVRSGRYDILTFEGGVDCLSYLDQHHDNIPIIFLMLDINMPQMNGFVLLDKIKSLYPHIEVHMATAYGGDDYKQKAKKLGASLYFEKPIDIEEVKAVIEQKISQQEPT